MSVRDQLARTLGGIVDRRAEAIDDVRPRKVVGRRDDGTLRLVRLGAECEERGGVSGAAIGQIVHAPRDTSLDRGAAGFASLSGSLSLIWIERQVPRELEIGTTQVVSVEGRGFFAGLRWEYLSSEDGDVHDGITVDLATFVDSETYQLTVTVDETVAIDTWPVAYG